MIRRSFPLPLKILVKSRLNAMCLFALILLFAFQGTAFGQLITRELSCGGSFSSGSRTFTVALPQDDEDINWHSVMFRYHIHFGGRPPLVWVEEYPGDPYGSWVQAYLWRAMEFSVGLRPGSGVDDVYGSTNGAISADRLTGNLTVFVVNPGVNCSGYFEVTSAAVLGSPRPATIETFSISSPTFQFDPNAVTSGIVFTAVTTKETEVIFEGYNPLNDDWFNFGPIPTQKINAKDTARAVWDGRLYDGSIASPGAYLVYAYTAGYSYSDELSLSILASSSFELTSVSASPKNILVDQAGKATALPQFVAHTTGQTVVNFKIRNPAGQTNLLGSSNAIKVDSDFVASFSCSAEKFRAFFSATGTYAVIAEAGSDPKEDTLIIEHTPYNSTGNDSSLQTSTDPSSTLFPNPETLMQYWFPDTLKINSQGYSSSVYVSDPVNIISGNFFAQTMDLQLKSRLPLRLTRNYNSLESSVGPFGRGWSFSYASRLEFLASDVVFISPDDSQVLFQKIEFSEMP